MTIRPIIFSAPMVRALLEGRKTQTRRLLKRAPQTFTVDGKTCEVGLLHVEGEQVPRVFCGNVLTTQKAPYARGDLLYVREAFATDSVVVRYAATDDIHVLRKVKPSIHMPRWASRLTLAVTDVRVQRLQCISDDDAVAEGARKFEDIPRAASVSWQLVPRWSMESPQTTDECLQAPKWAFGNYWIKLHGQDSWDQNPWVVAVTFTVHKCNVDHFASAGKKGAA